MVAPPSAPPPGPLSEDVSPPVLLVAVRDSHLVQPPPALLHWKLPFLPFTLPSGPRPLVVGVLVGCLVGLACIWQGLSARTPRPRRTEAQQLAPGHVDNATTGLAAVQAQLRINEQHLEDARRLLVEQAQLAAQEKACLDWERFELGVIAEQLQEELRQATAAKQAEAKRFERERRTMEGRVRLAEKNLEDQERIEAQTVIFLAEEARQGPLAKKQLKAARQEIKELRKKIEEDATQTAASKQELKARCRLAEQRLKQEQEVHSQEAIVARLERERLHEVLAARDASPTNIPSIALPPTSTRASPAAPPGAASSSSYLLPSPPSILTLSQISPRAPVQDTGDDTPARSHPDAPFGARREAHVARFGYSDVQAGGPLSASGQERFVERELRHYGPCDAEETEMVRNFAGVKVGLGHSNGARPRHSRSRT
ncbi:hypothetical protein DFH09DRAFT_1139059 [Mycena vulgaris]|nr:hypothetical protein DFH09DRAFT_1139059 [Mycena vulgaris]